MGTLASLMDLARQSLMANQAAIIDFRYEMLSASKADEDYQQVMEHLVRRATAAKA